MKHKVLTLAYACLGQSLNSLLKQIEKMSINTQVDIVIVVQKALKKQKENCYPEHIRVIFIDSVGLSRSRNEAIKNIHSDYVWFLDDDVLIVDEDIQKLLAILSVQTSIDVFRVKIGCLEWPNKCFKNYKMVPKVRRLNLLQVSSIEVIMKSQFIKQHALSFNNHIGLGTPYQGAEEIHFMLDAWDKGATFKFVDETLIRHTCIFEGRTLANHNIFEIRGATASRFGLLSLLLMARWSIRYLAKERKLSYIASMFKGYFRGYDYFRNMK